MSKLPLHSKPLVFALMALLLGGEVLLGLSTRSQQQSSPPEKPRVSIKLGQEVNRIEINRDGVLKRCTLYSSPRSQIGRECY